MGKIIELPKGIEMYEVIGRDCSCSPDKPLILRMMTDGETKEYKKQNLSKSAVFACRHGCGTVVSWQFQNRDVKFAARMLENRYELKPYFGKWKDTYKDKGE